MIKGSQYSWPEPDKINQPGQGSVCKVVRDVLLETNEKVQNEESQNSKDMINRRGKEVGVSL